MIALSTTVSQSFYRNQDWSYHKVTLHSAKFTYFEKHPNTSQSVICFRDIASVLAIDITMKTKQTNKRNTNFHKRLQCCQNNEEIGTEERYT